jgi:phosphoglycerate dehydrogenase-like enzyme
MSEGTPLSVVVHARFARPPILARLAEIDGVTVTEAETLAQIADLARDADVLAIPDPSPADGELIAAALSAPDCRVRLVQCLSAGFDGLLRYLVPERVAVTAQGGAMAVPVAEHAVALLLGLTRQIATIGERSRAATWDRNFDPPLTSLEGKTAAIIGFGHIGCEVAKRLRAFGMHVIAVARRAPDAGLADEHVPFAALPDALARADVIVVTVALAEETRGLFGTRILAACKPGVLLINVARGEIVDQAALRVALESGTLGGAAIDVTVPEPLPVDDPLWQAPRLIISPHVAGAGSTLAARKLSGLVAENVRRLRDGEPFLHQVR